MRFWPFLGRRLIQTVITLFAVVTLMWALFRLIPGDPTTVFLGTGELPPDAVAALRKSWGLDAPLWQQYLDYLRNLITGNLGLSFYYRRPVLEILLPMLWNTLLLMGFAVTAATLVGIAVGSWLGWRRGDKTEQIGTLLVLIPRALPIFWIGILLQMAFAYGLGWFPIGGMRTPAFIPETRLEQLPGYDLGVHMVLPLLAAAIYFVTDPLMIMRTSMLEVAGDDFVTFARATGSNAGRSPA